LSSFGDIDVNLRAHQRLAVRMYGDSITGALTSFPDVIRSTVLVYLGYAL
jgi:hypothetical protein